MMGTLIQKREHKIENYCQPMNCPAGRGLMHKVSEPLEIKRCTHEGKRTNFNASGEVFKLLLSFGRMKQLLGKENSGDGCIVPPWVQLLSILMLLRFYDFIFTSQIENEKPRPKVATDGLTNTGRNPLVVLEVNQ